MSTEALASHIEYFASFAGTSPGLIFLFILIFMAIESSFIPFPSEIVMIPAGFLLYRYAMPTGNHTIDFILVSLCGLAGSMIGAYVNYFLSMWLGRPFLHKYGKYFFLKPATLDRAEEIFRKYGEAVTFVSRLLPAIRQLISIPAGLSRMNFFRFSLFTALGAGIWGAILTGIGYWFGRMTGDMTYPEMITRGKEIISKNYGWIILGLIIFCAVYAFVHKKIMGPSGKAEQK